MSIQPKSTLRASHPAIRLGRVVPNFVLPSTSGGQYGPGALRSKYNMVIAFLDAGGQSGQSEDYLNALSAAYLDILEEQARAIAVVKVGLSGVRELQQRLALPYPLLADQDGELTARMLGGPGLSALVVADRFGEAYCLESASAIANLPTTRKALEWLQFIQVQCPE